MESTPPTNTTVTKNTSTNKKSVARTDNKARTPITSIADISDSELIHSDEGEEEEEEDDNTQEEEDDEDDDDDEQEQDSHTEGKPSPPHTPRPRPRPRPRPQRPTQIFIPIVNKSPSVRDRSHSPTRSKKRAISTMLDGEEDKECINVAEKPAPPLPKRNTSKSPIKSTRPSPPSPAATATAITGNTVLDTPLYVRGDAAYETALEMLLQYRKNSRGGLDPGEPVLVFFNEWLKESRPNLVVTVDALFDLLLEQYNPLTDDRLVVRIPLFMNQILQRK
jgi:hypothetical protein